MGWVGSQDRVERPTLAFIVTNWHQEVVCHGDFCSRKSTPHNHHDQAEPLALKSFTHLPRPLRGKSTGAQQPNTTCAYPHPALFPIPCSSAHGHYFSKTLQRQDPSEVCHQG